MAALDQEPDVGEILSKINGMIVSGCLYECPSTNNLVTSGKQKTCKIRKSIEKLLNNFEFIASTKLLPLKPLL